MSAWHEVELWLKQNVVALSSFIVTGCALVLSFKRFKHDTRPKLILTSGSEGIEVENVGQTTAVNITLTLVERVRRPSGKLSVPTDALRPGEKSTIVAFDWPDTLEVPGNEILDMSEWVLRMDGRKVPYPREGCIPSSGPRTDYHNRPVPGCRPLEDLCKVVLVGREKPAGIPGTGPRSHSPEKSAVRVCN